MQILRVFGNEELGSEATHRDENEGAGELLLAFARQAGAIAAAVTLSTASLAAQTLQSYSGANQDEHPAAAPYLQEDNGPPSPVIVEPPRPWSGWNEDFPGYDPYEEDGPRFVVRIRGPVMPPDPWNEEWVPQPVGGGGGISRVPVSLFVRYSGEEIVPEPAPGSDDDEDDGWKPPLVIPQTVVVRVPSFNDELAAQEATAVDEEQSVQRHPVALWRVTPGHLWGEDEAAPQGAALEEEGWRRPLVIPPQNNSVLFLGDEARGQTPAPPLEDLWWPVPIIQHTPAKRVAIVDEEWVPTPEVFEDDQVLKLHSVPAPIRLRDVAGDTEEWVPFFTPTMVDEPGPVLFSVAPRTVLPPAPFDEETVPFVVVPEEDQWSARIVVIPTNHAAAFDNEELGAATVSEEDQPPVLFSVKAPVVLPVFVDEEWVETPPVYGDERGYTPPTVAHAPTVLPPLPETDELPAFGFWLEEDLWQPPLVVNRPPVPLVIFDEGSFFIAPSSQALKVVDRSRPLYDVTDRSRPLYEITDRSRY